MMRLVCKFLVSCIVGVSYCFAAQVPAAVPHALVPSNTVSNAAAHPMTTQTTATVLPPKAATPAQAAAPVSAPKAAAPAQAVVQVTLPVSVPVVAPAQVQVATPVTSAVSPVVTPVQTVAAPASTAASAQVVVPAQVQVATPVSSVVTEPVVAPVQAAVVSPVTSGVSADAAQAVVTAPIVDQPAAQPSAPSVVQESAAPAAAPEEAPLAQPFAESEDEITGIDTADLDEPQGNWLFKRMWWQRAETQYEKIKALVDTIMESRMAFFAKRTEWDKTVFDPFYLEIGVGRGILEEMIANAIAQLDQEREKDGQLSPQERDLLAAFETEKATLEQLQKDIQKINAIDGAIDDAITTLIGQINAARNFEKQSWQNLKQIAQELSDKKARDLYYGMATFWQNANDISSYIQNPFLQYFEGLGASAKESIAKVTDSMKALKEKGIDFKQQWQNLEAKHALARDAKEYNQGAHVQQEEMLEKEKQAQSERGFMGTIVHSITSTISSVINAINNGALSVWNFTVGRFFKSSPKIEVSLPTPPVPHEEQRT